MAHTNGNARAALYFVAGGLVGAGLALILAPQSGRRTRRDLRHLGVKALNGAESIRTDVRHSVENWMEEFSETLKDVVSQGREWSDATRLQAQQALEIGKQHIEREIEKFKP